MKKLTEEQKNVASDIALTCNEDINDSLHEDWPKELEKGRFTEYCKRNGFKGPCLACAKKAMDSGDASVRGMASFYMNTVKPKGKDASDVS